VSYEILFDGERWAAHVDGTLLAHLTERTAAELQRAAVGIALGADPRRRVVQNIRKRRGEGEEAERARLAAHVVHLRDLQDKRNARARAKRAAARLAAHQSPAGSAT